MKKRLTICVFWDKEGVLREYALFYIKSLIELSQRTLIVVNGHIIDKSKKTLEDLGCEVILRENLALDFGAYKHGIYYIGYEKLSEYDNLILTNTTCYGPVYPFSEMFDEMDNRDCDFWGLTEHKSYDDADWLHKHVHDHLQSYFLTFKKNVFMSEAFYNFFDSIKNDQALPYKDIINLYETELTHYFEINGFKSSSYIDCKAYYDEDNFNPCYLSTLELLKEQRIPLVKRKAIVFDANLSIKKYQANKCFDLLEFIRNHTDYDTDMILKDLIRDYPISKLKFALHLNYILPDDYKISNNTSDKSPLGVVLFVKSLTNIDVILDRFANLPDGSSIVFITKRESVLTELKKLCQTQIHNRVLSKYNLEFKAGNDDTDMYEAYFVLASDLYKKHEYVLALQSFDENYLNTDKYYKHFYQNMVTNMLISKIYVSNIISKFKNNTLVGLMVPNLPLTNKYDDLMWGKRIDQIDIMENSLDMRNQLRIHVPNDTENLAAYCGLFYVRSSSLKFLFDSGYDLYSLKNQEPLMDYVINTGFDFLLPQLVQESGYLTASVIPLSDAPRYNDCLCYNNKVKDNIFAPCPTVYSFRKSDYSALYLKKITLSDFFNYLCTVRKTPDRKFKYLTILGFNILLKKVKQKHK